MNYFGFTLLHSVIGSKFPRHVFNQSEVKPKPIVARACTFSCALCRLRVITWSFDWFTGLSQCFLIGQSNYRVLRHSVKTALICVVNDLMYCYSFFDFHWFKPVKPCLHRKKKILQALDTSFNLRQKSLKPLVRKIT